MINRIVLVAIVVPIAIVVIALAVANRGWVPFTLDPFHPGNPALTIQLPLFVFLFVALALGVLLGSFATWLKQGRYRRLAKLRGAEASALRTAQDTGPKLPKPAA